MSTIDPSNLESIVGQLSEDGAHSDTIDALISIIYDLLEENKELRGHVEALEQQGEIRDSRLDAMVESLERVEDEIEDGQARSGDSNPASNEDETAPQPEQTPLERVIDDPDTSGVHVTASVQRAMSIAGHFHDWCSKGAYGARSVTKNLRTLLGAVEDETLAWKQVYRAAETLENLSNGALTFKKTRRHGWIIELEDDAFLSRVVSEKSGG